MFSSSSWRWIVFAGIAMIAILLQVYATPCGLLSTFDSVNYLSAANSFRESGVFLNNDGTYYTYFGPLFPIILSAFRHPEFFLAWANPLMTVAIAFLMARLVQRVTSDFALQLIGFISVMWSVQLLMISVFIWSELFFLLLLTLLIFILTRRDLSNVNFTIAVFIALLLCLQRNAGLFILSGVSIAYAMESDWRRKIPGALILLVAGTSGLWIWNYYVSWIVPGDFETLDQPFFGFVFHNFNFLAASLARAFLPLPSGGWLVFLFMAIVIGTILFNAIKKDSLIRLIVFAIGFYLLGMSSLFELDVYDGDRYVSVILPFFILLMIKCTEIFLSTKTSRTRLVLMVLASLLLCYPLARTVKNSQLWRQTSCSIK